MGLGQRGMLQVKQTLERLQLSSFNGQSNTPAFCLAEEIKNMISGLSESFEVDALSCESKRPVQGYFI